jgi:hypothetical protein
MFHDAESGPLLLALLVASVVGFAYFAQPSEPSRCTTSFLRWWASTEPINGEFCW